MVQKNETIQTKSLENDFENELKTTNSSVHKVSNPVISLAKKLGLESLLSNNLPVSTSFFAR